MTSNTTPSGEVFSDSVYSTSAIYQSWCGFSSLVSNAWVSARANAPHYLGYNFKDKEVKVARYSVTSRKLDGNDSKTPPKTWSFEGSNNGTDWTVLDTQVNITWTSTWEEKEFNILSKKQNYYLYYRIYITEGTTENFEASIGLLKMFGYKNPKRIILTNDNSHYSLSDNTLIHIPDNSNKNMILHGIEQGKEIQLDVPFTKHKHFNSTPVANGSSKVFTHDIGKINTLSIKEFIDKDFEPLNIWHEIVMTSNNTPSPLIASASSEYSTAMQAWKAFNGTVADANDRWRSADGIANQWLKIDFGKQVLVSKIKFTSVYDGSTVAGSPIEFTLEGSNDDSTWEKISDISTTSFKTKEDREFIFDIVNYRYFRITPTKNQGGVNYYNIGDIKFGYKREVN